jgi:chaperonin GroES
MLMSYAITGSEFKKTYFCPIKEKNVSELVMAKDLVVDYWAKSLETAARVTHIIELNKNCIVERINAGVFRADLSIDDFGQPEQDDADSKSFSAANDEDAPHMFLEQHRWLDLDDDGYQEPYIVTVHKQSATVVRICARYDVSGVILTDDGRMSRIEPVNYFTHFKFMPAIDGGFYGMGFGKLLFGLNNAVNAITNQLIDAGTANNRMSGFIGRGIQIGRTSASTDGFTLGTGEWKNIPSTGDDVRKNIVPMPSKEPSSVLFTMLQFLIETGKELSSVSDILSGESPGPNVPAASTLALIEQGMKVFSGIFKRLYRSLKDEFRKIARLNRLYLPEESYFAVLDDEMAIFQEDYSETSLDIVPVADPNSLSDMGRAMKMQALMQLAGQGFNDMAIKKRYLESLSIENVEELLPPEDAGPPPIPPEVQAQIDKLNAEAKKIEAETVESSVRAQFAGMQAANVIATTPSTAPIADALLLSAGFVDRNLPPVVPQDLQMQPGLPQLPQNSSPGFPALPATGEAGAMQGIETQVNEGSPT